MNEYVFLFDLDSTLTKEEILPKIAKEIGKLDEMKELTERTMLGEIPFKESFIERVNILKDIPVSKVNKIICNISLNENVKKFISENKSRCYIVTGNLDIWIKDLMEELGMENNYFSSKALVENNRLTKIISVIDKKAIVSQFISPYVAIGDGDNDAEMIDYANIGIGFGAVRPIASSVLACADYAFYEEEALCQFLERLL